MSLLNIKIFKKKKKKSLRVKFYRLKISILTFELSRKSWKMESEYSSFQASFNKLKKIKFWFFTWTPTGLKIYQVWASTRGLDLKTRNNISALTRTFWKIKIYAWAFTQYLWQLKSNLELSLELYRLKLSNSSNSRWSFRWI